MKPLLTHLSTATKAALEEVAKGIATDFETIYAAYVHAFSFLFHDTKMEKALALLW